MQVRLSPNPIMIKELRSRMRGGRAFLTLTVEHGFDYVLGTPWRGYEPLADDHYVLNTYKNFLEQKGSNALRAVRKFYRA